MTRSRSNPFLDLGPLSLLTSYTLFWFAHTVVDPDLWGHIRFGQDIIRTGSIIQSDTYSYRTGAQPWINHEWLSEVIFARLYNRSGPSGLIAFKVLVSLLLLGLSYAHLTRCGLGPLRSVLLLILIGIPFRMGLGTIRPQLFTYLIFLIQLLLLERATAGRAYWLWVLPILYAFWVNLHGGVLAGVGILGIWITVQIVERLRDDTRPRVQNLGAMVGVALLGVACGLALLLNPYRAALVEFLLRTATVPRPEIGEWSPLGLMSYSGQLYLGLLAIGILGLVFSTRRRKPEAILIFSVTAIVPLISQRHYPLFLLALVVLGGEHIADVWNRWLRPMSSGSGHGRLITAVCLAVSMVLIGLSPPRFACIRIEPYYFAFPARAVALLKQSGVRGNIAVPFVWGEYVLWQLGPGVKVSIDGRRETVYSDESYGQSLNFERGTGAWDALLKPATTDLVLAPNGSPMANLMSRTHGWVPLYQDTFSLLFVREGFSSLARILENPIPALPDNGDGLCFPHRGRS
ncbi:MAG: hypothetical protein ACHRXM_07945 [Isosphaerales bacterium]